MDFLESLTFLGGSTESSSSHATPTSVQTTGKASSLNNVIGSSAFFIAIGAVVILEKVFHLFHHYTHGTAYYQMLTRIEKELMVVGFISFIFKLILNYYHYLDHSWHVSLEFAGLILLIYKLIL
jgi:hypothetical protein